MDIVLLGIIAAVVGVLFCTAIAVGVAREKSGTSPAHEMLNLFDIVPEDV